MVNKKIMLLAIFLVSLLAISAVNAADNITGDIVSSDDSSNMEIMSGEETNLVLSSQNINEDMVKEASDGEVVSAGPASFSDLKVDMGQDVLINGSPSILLHTDYMRRGNESKIYITSEYIHIYGNNHIIDGNNVPLGIFDCQYDGSEEIVFEDITFLNGNHPYGGGAFYGEYDFVGYVTFINCTFKNCYNAIYGGRVTAINCRFTDNYGFGNCAAIYAGTAINCTFINNIVTDSGGAMAGSAIGCTFINNQATRYGGAMNRGSATDCTFIGNKAADGGGAISGVTATNCIFKDNNGGAGGAIFQGTATNCIFTDNNANDGGAIFRSTATNCIFTNNSANNYGGAISDHCTAINCTFNNNHALVSGGAMEYYSTATDCTFTNNFVESYAIGGYDVEGHGGAMSLYCTATDCTFTNNFVKGNSVGCYGGAMENSNAINCIFINNHAEQSGAIHHGNATGCTFINNSANTYGGAIYDGSAVNCSFNGNLAKQGGAIYDGSAVNCSFIENHAEHGGAIYGSSATGCNFTNNQASKAGGAMADKTAIDCQFTNNTAPTGGALWNGKAINCSFISNHATNGGAMSGKSAENCSFIINKAEKTGGAAAGCIVTNCNFTNNTAGTFGGAIVGSDAENCIFNNNQASTYGGAMYDGSATNCIFINNMAIQGGAMFEGSAINCSFKNNQADTYGGAIYESNAENCTFTNNQADYGGAMYAGSATNCTFNSNHADYGGAMYNGSAMFCICKTSSDTFEGTDVQPSLIVANFSSIFDSGDKLLFNLTCNGQYYNGYNVIITVNQKGKRIGVYHGLSGEGWLVTLIPGVYNATLSLDPYTVNTVNVTLTIGNGTFRNLNRSINQNNNDKIDLYGYYIYSDGDDEFIDGIKISREVTIDGHGMTIDGAKIARIFEVTYKNVIFKNITFINGNGGTQGYGGAVYKGTSIDCTFKDNNGTYGGAIDRGNAINCTFTNNSAKIDGGSIYQGTAENCIFTNCTSFSGGAMSYYSTAINCTFLNNRADYGGAMDGSTAINCTFINNQATLGSGGAMFEGTALNCIFVNNTSPDEGEAVFQGKIGLCTFINNTNERTVDITDLLSVSDFTSIYGSDEKFLFNLKYGDYLFSGFNTTISVYQNEAFVANYSALSGDGWIFSLKPGIYNATLNVKGYNVNPVTSTLTINKVPTDISTDVADIITLIADNTTGVGAKLNNMTSQFKYTSSNDDIASVDENGIITAHKAGVANITISFKENETHLSSNKSIKVIVDYIDTTIFATDIDINVTKTANINAVLTPGQVAKLIYTSNNESIVTVDENGTITGVHVGVANITIDFEGTEKYRNSTKTIKVTVKIIQTRIKVNDTLTVFVGESQKIGAELTPDANELKYSSNDTSIASINQDGTITPHNVGTALITVSYNGNENYSSSKATVKITVKPTNSSVKIGTDDITYSQTISIPVTSENATGIDYEIFDQMGNNVKNGTLKPGENITGLNLGAGEYCINLTTKVTKNHIPVTYSTKLTVSPANSVVKADDITVKHGENSIVKITSENATLINYRLISELGVAAYGFAYPGENIVFYNLPVGNYTVDLTTSVDKNHEVANFMSKIIVEPVTPVKLDGEWGIVIDAGNVTEINFRIINDEDEVLANGIIKPNESIIDDLVAGNYVIAFNLQDGESYGLINSSALPQVQKSTTKFTVINVTTTYNVNKDLIVTLKDGQDNPLVNISVFIDINGVKIYTTDENGQIKVPTGSLIPKSYTAIIFFDGNDNYMESYAIAKVVVKKATPKMTAKAKTFKRTDKIKKYTVILKTIQNKVMKNTKVTIKVNKKTYSAKTNSKGVATFKLTKLTKKGKYTATVKYAGSKYYNAKIVKSKITVK